MVNIPDDMYQAVNVTRYIYIALVITCIGFSWWALQAFRFDVLLKNPKGPQAKLLQIFLSLVLGYEVAKFIIDYATWSLLIGNLSSLFGKLF